MLSPAANLPPIGSHKLRIRTARGAILLTCGNVGYRQLGIVPRISKRIFATFIGALGVLAGLYFGVSEALWAIGDFKDPQVSFQSALAGNIVGWSLTAAAIVLGIRMLRFGLVRSPVATQSGATETK